MKNAILKIIAKAAEKSIKSANNKTCEAWSYQPVAPKNIKNFKK